MSVAVDVATDGGAFSGVFDVSWSHAGGTPDYISVGVGSITGGTAGIDVHTYNSVAMTEVSRTAQAGIAGVGGETAIYGLVAPASGTKTVALHMQNSSHFGDAGSVTYTGVDQTVPTGTPVTAEQHDASTATTHTHTMSTTAGNIIFDAITIGSTTGTPTVSGTSRFFGKGADPLYCGGGQTVVAGGSVAVTWTWTTAANYIHNAVEILAAAASGVQDDFFSEMGAMEFDEDGAIAY